MMFTGVAKRKIQYLLQRDGEEVYRDAKIVRIRVEKPEQFPRIATIDTWGKVTWELTPDNLGNSKEKNEMSLLDQIKSDQLTARKARTARASLLTTLLGEATKVGKDSGNRETTDKEVMAVIRKFIKGLDSILEVRPHDETATFEKVVLEAYLPKHMSDADLIGCIELYCNLYELSGPKDMGKIMKFLERDYPEQYAGSKAATLTRSILKL